MSIVLKSSILHILDNTSVMPVLSDMILEEKEDINNYITEMMEKAFYSDDIKECFFHEEHNFWRQFQDPSWNLIAISKNIATQIFTIMRRNSDIPAGDVLMGLITIDENDHFFMIKLDYKNAFTHYVNTTEGTKSVSVISYKTLLPNQSVKVNECFFVNLSTPSVKVMERKCHIDGIKDFYLSTQVLGCSESQTPRQKTTKLLRVAEKVAELYYSSADDMGSHISTTMFEELQQDKPLLVEDLGQRFFSANPAAQKEFFERLEASDISREETLSLSERFKRKFQKQAIKSTSGVEIKIPTQVYSNFDEIEFINNPNGTVSILIKNIQL